MTPVGLGQNMQMVRYSSGASLTQCLAIDYCLAMVKSLSSDFTTGNLGTYLQVVCQFLQLAPHSR